MSPALSAGRTLKEQHEFPTAQDRWSLFGPSRAIAQTSFENSASTSVAKKCEFEERGPSMSAGRKRLLF
jgi:hypothetical protein